MSNGEHPSGQAPLPEENVVASVANDHGGSQSAYPLSIVSGSMSEIYGLTKRELFAAMAMHALICKTPPETLDVDDPGHLPDEVACGAVDYADSLLKELCNV